jgi:hypothetical protein
LVRRTAMDCPHPRPARNQSDLERPSLSQCVEAAISRPSIQSASANLSMRVVLQT